MELETVQTNEKPPRGITGNTLKMIAIVTMLIDHIGAGLIEPYIGLYNEGALKNMETISLKTMDGLYLLDIVMRTVGRIAFPIFCYLLVEGFLHTRSWKKYGLRLLLFGLLSEVPYDLLFNGSWFYLKSQNVYFTLLIGLLTVVGCRRFAHDFLMKLIVLLCGCGAAALIKCDYEAIGVIMIAAFYEFRLNKKQQVIYGGIVALLESLSLFGAAALAVIPIWRYRGKRGKMNLKYFFYWFYPVHLALLCAVQYLIVR